MSAFQHTYERTEVGEGVLQSVYELDEVGVHDGGIGESMSRKLDAVLVKEMKGRGRQKRVDVRQV